MGEKAIEMWNERNGEGWAASPLTGMLQYDQCSDCGLLFEIPKGAAWPLGWRSPSMCRACDYVYWRDVAWTEAREKALRAREEKREREERAAAEAARVAAEEARQKEERENLRKEVEALSVAKKNPLKYGITPEDYQAMCEAQGWVCPVCTRRCAPIKFLRASGEDPIGLVFALDHDDALLGTLDKEEQWRCVRGLLCSPCNSAFGLLRENPEAVDGLLNYAKFFAAGGKNKVLLERRGKK